MPLASLREKGAHLLRRFGLGASEAELDYYLRDGLEGAIDSLLDYGRIEEIYDYDLLDLMALNGKPVNPQLVSAWWTLKLVTTRRPLQEKMTLFWHNHFATSAEKVASGEAMYNQIELLRAGATGSFRDLLLKVAQDPAMLFWLDNQFNVKGKPNENFAREVMELFTLGEGQGYTETDIKEGARAFTGWGVTGAAQTSDLPKRGTRFRFVPGMHDDGEKTFLGKTGPFDGTDIIDILCERPRTSEFLVNKIWEWFVYPNPEPKLVQSFAKKFRTSGLNISDLLRDIMRSPEFYSDRAYRSVYKNPVDFVIPTLRQLGIGPILGDRVKAAADVNVRQMGPVVAGTLAMKQMGMYLLFPPDVSGWPKGPMWVSSATMVARIGWGDKLFGQATGPGVNEFTSLGLFEKDLSPTGVAETLVSIFDAPVESSKISALAAAAEKASGGEINPTNVDKSAAAVAKLLFSTPEFQFC